MCLCQICLKLFAPLFQYGNLQLIKKYFKKVCIYSYQKRVPVVCMFHSHRHVSMPSYRPHKRKQLAGRELLALAMTRSCEATPTPSSEPTSKQSLSLEPFITKQKCVFLLIDNNPLLSTRKHVLRPDWLDAR